MVQKNQNTILKYAYMIFSILAAAYLIYSLSAPVDPEAIEKYQVSETQLRLYGLPITLMVIGIWYSLAYGYVRLKRYALTISKDADGKAINVLANAVGVMALQIVLGNILSIALKRLGAAEEVTTLASTYFGITLGLYAFYLLDKGSRMLAETIKSKKKPNSLAVMMGFAVVVIVYVVSIIITKNSQLEVRSTSATSILGIVPLLLTVVLPYIISWYLGVIGFVNLHHYYREVKGVIYKRVFKKISQGVLTIVLASVFIQLISSFGTDFESLGLAPILAIVYVIVVFFAYGYLMIAQGAKKLQVIEEV
jgi:hypothetical protein